jgi:hypothetical protein
MACFHESNAICHHTLPEALRLRHPLTIIFSDGLQQAIKPQVVEMGRNVKVALTMEGSETL